MCHVCRRRDFPASSFRLNRCESGFYAKKSAESEIRSEFAYWPNNARHGRTSVVLLRLFCRKKGSVRFERSAAFVIAETENKQNTKRFYKYSINVNIIPGSYVRTANPFCFFFIVIVGASINLLNTIGQKKTVLQKFFLFTFFAPRASLNRCTVALCGASAELTRAIKGLSPPLQDAIFHSKDSTFSCQNSFQLFTESLKLLNGSKLQSLSFVITSVCRGCYVKLLLFSYVITEWRRKTLVVKFDLIEYARCGAHTSTSAISSLFWVRFFSFLRPIRAARRNNNSDGKPTSFSRILPRYYSPRGKFFITCLRANFLFPTHTRGRKNSTF